MNYSELAFTDGVKAIQQRLGSRAAYERVERMSFVDGLTMAESNFIDQIDSFFLASYGENEYPYIQHRGGPAGFVKVLDAETIGMVDFGGNRQYISVGNIRANPKVSLIMVSYPLRARLKVYAEAEVVEISTSPELFEKLKPQEYKFRPERMLIFHIKAYDWNCPQHIVPKYTISEIEEINKPREQYIKSLEEELVRWFQKAAHILAQPEVQWKTELG